MFQGGGKGWAYLSAGPTAGYIVGFIAATWLVGDFVVYVPGLLWLGAFGFVSWEAFPRACTHAPGDVVKLMSASIVVGGLCIVADKRRR